MPIPQHADLQKKQPKVTFPSKISRLYAKCPCNPCLELPSEFAGANLIWVRFEFDFIDAVQFRRKHHAVGSQRGQGVVRRLTGLFNGTWGRGDKNSHWQVGQPPREGGSDPCRGQHSVRWRQSKWRFWQDAQSLTHGTCSNPALCSPELSGSLNTRATSHLWVPRQVIPCSPPPGPLGRLAIHLSKLSSGASLQKDASPAPCLLMTRAGGN